MAERVGLVVSFALTAMLDHRNAFACASAALTLVLSASVASAQPLAREEARLSPVSGSATHGGAAVAIAGDIALVGVPGTGTGATHGTVYAYHRTAPATWILEQTITDPEPVASATMDKFGSSIAIAGSTAIVGDPNHGSFAGQAWILTRGGGTPAWTSARIAAPSGAPTSFGASVAISMDTIVIGAPDSGGGRVGAVYVFQLAGALTTAQITTPAAIAASALFGTSVAVGGTSVLVGAPGANQVYTFETDGSSYTQGTTLTGPSAGSFGGAVAISPSGLFAAIGASEESSHGAAYVITRANSSAAWPDAGMPLVPAGLSTSDHFGSSIAATDDAVVVGSPNHDGTSADTGSVYLFSLDRTDGSWHEASSYYVSTGMGGDQLGTSVAVSATSLLGGAPRPMGTLGFAAVFPFPLAVATGCTLAERCASGFCVDGVCCASACGESVADDCMACSTAHGGTADGTCTAARETMSCTACGTPGMCSAMMCMTSGVCDAGTADVDTGMVVGTDGGPGTDGGAPVHHHISGCKCEVGRAGGGLSPIWLFAAVLGLLARRRARG